MRRYILYIIALMTIVSSCGPSYVTLQVSGTPGTIIKNSDSQEVLGTIGNTGNLSINLDRDQYYAYLLAKSPYSNRFVPFALEYEENARKYKAVSFGNGMGIALASMGLGLEFTGLVMVIVSEATMGGGLTAIGGGLGLTGALGLGLPMTYKLSYSDIRNCYDYLPARTNDDLFLNSNLQKVYKK